MKPFIIIISCLIVIVGWLGYISYEQDKLIQQLQTEPAEVEPVEFRFEWIEPTEIDRFIEVDILGKIQWIPVDSEGRVK